MRSLKSNLVFGLIILPWWLFAQQSTDSSNASESLNTASAKSLIWSDEFDSGTGPDTSKWSFESGFVRNQELQWYTDQNAFIENDKLIIEARQVRFKNSKYLKNSANWRTNRKTVHYTSTCIKTRGKFSFQYGTVEVKAKIDTASGLWPAIWLLGQERKWPANGEIDMMEFYRYQNQQVILANTAYSLNQMGGQPIWNSTKVKLEDLIQGNPNWPNEFHIWKMDWTADFIALYLDGQLLNQVSLADKTDEEGFNPFRQPYYLLLNLAIGSNGGEVKNTSFPRRYEIDYVRVFQ